MKAESYFLPYQEAWIADASPIKASKKSRRVGYSYASSYRMFQKCMTKPPGFTQWVSSRDMFTAQELIKDYIAKWCKLANVAARGIYADNIQVFDPAKDIKAFVCDFPNSNRLVSLSSTPEVFAGKGGDVFLDEVDLHQNSADLIDMAFPCTTWGGQLEMVSAYSVRGSAATPWARLIASAEAANPQGVSLHTCTIHDAVAQGLVEKINAATHRTETRDAFIARMRASCRTLAAWQSQFECIVQDGDGKLIPIGDICAAELPPLQLAAIIAAAPTAPRYGGYDVARRVHAAAWHEYALVGNTLMLARREKFRDTPFDTQEAWIRARLTDAAQPRIHRMAIDSTGLGMHMAERLTRDYPGQVDSVNLESSRRHQLVMAFAERFTATRTIRIPTSDQLRADLHAPDKAIAPNGNLRIIIPAFNDADGEISHADEFMAGVLASSAADEAGAIFCPPPRAATTRRAKIRATRRRHLRDKPREGATL